MNVASIIDHAARAAFATRYKRRPWCQFDAQPMPVQSRWSIVAANVLYGTVTNGRQFRERYVEGFANVKHWSEIGTEERFSWQSVYDAARLVGMAAVQLDRTAA